MGTKLVLDRKLITNWRDRTKLLLGGIAVAALSVGMLVTGPAPAQAAESPPGTTQVPEGVSVAAYELSRVNDSGDVIDNRAPGPGSTFFASYIIRNTSAEPVTVVGFESAFFVRMHPNRQGDLPDDYCMQFFETRNFDDRQSYPQVVEPDDAVIIHDNTTHHYLYTPDNPSNACQQASFMFGAPIFQTTETVTAQEPEWREATCDASAAVIIPDARGVQYELDGEPVDEGTYEVAADAEVTVMASADEDFEIPDTDVVDWAHAFTAPDCDDEGGTGENGDDGTGNDGASDAADSSSDDAAVTAATTGGGHATLSTLPATGGNDSPLPWVTGLAAMLLGLGLITRQLLTAVPKHK